MKLKESQEYLKRNALKFLRLSNRIWRQYADGLLLNRIAKKRVEYYVIFIYKRLSLDSQTKYYSKGKVMVLW